MTAQSCIEAIRAALGEGATDEQVERVAAGVDRRARRLRRQDPLLSQEDALLGAAKELGDEAKLAALVEKRSRTINILRRKQRQARYEARPGREAKAAQEILAGSQSGLYGAARSVHATGQALQAGLLGPMKAELTKAGVLDLLRGGGKPFQRDVARELFRLTDKTGAESGNKLAAETARILGKYQEKARQMMNDAGAWIGKLDGYVTRQSHDQYRIRKAGYDAWRAEIEPRLDPRTFDDTDDPEAFLKAVYAGLSSGVHLTARGAADAVTGFKGPGNLAKRASAERVLHFKSADDWFDYNERFGTRDLFASVAAGIRSASRDTALMRAFGTNPEAAFTADMERLAIAARDAGDFKAAEKLAKAARKQGLLGAIFKGVSGELDIPGNVTLANWGHGLRAWQGMAKLGGVVLSSFPDIAARASTLRHHGIPYAASVADGFASVLRGRGSAEQREIADLIGVGIDGMLGSVFARFTSADSVPGQASALLDFFMKVNLQSFWQDAQATGIGLMLSRNLAHAVRKGWDELGEDLRRSLGRFEIGAAEWDQLRQAELRQADGRAYLVPDDVADAATALKLRTYYIDTAQEAMTMPGAFERAITTAGTQRGTLVGEAVRVIMQFKAYGVTFASRQIGRELRRKGAADFAGLAALIVGTTTLGLVSLQAKEVTKGRSPRAPGDAAGLAKLFTAAMVQGGGLGIYGDFLFGKYNRFGQGPIASAAGPMVGTTEDTLKLLGKVVSGDWQDLPADATRFGVNNTPFINLFYTRQALDWLILYDLQEAMSPGYLQRMERRIRQENGQRFLLQPSQHRARPFTG